MPVVWSMRRSKVVQVGETEIATVEAIDGRPLPKGRLLGDEVECNQFQDGEAFLDNGGFKRPPGAIIPPRAYRVNPFLVNVAQQPPAGGASRQVGGATAQDRQPRPPQIILPPPPHGASPASDKTIQAAVERLLVPERTRRGIWRSPVAPGKYNLNRVAFTAYMVPTSAIMVDWARSERPDAPSLARRPAEPRADESDYPYLTEQGEKGLSFFRFGQLLVTSKYGFKSESDVRMVIRILPENAAFVIARFGSVFNLIQQIVHPLIDASFRNKAGEKK